MERVRAGGVGGTKGQRKGGLHVRGVPAQLDGDEVVRDLLAREGLARRRAEHRVVLLDQVALRLVARRAVRRRANELQHLAALEDERRVELLGRWRRAVRTRDEDVDAAALVEEVQGDGRLPRRLLLDAVEDVVELWRSSAQLSGVWARAGRGVDGAWGGAERTLTSGRRASSSRVLFIRSADFIASYLRLLSMRTSLTCKASWPRACAALTSSAE